jgi:hypothetical protein
MVKRVKIFLYNVLTRDYIIIIINQLLKTGGKITPPIMLYPMKPDKGSPST